MNHYEILLMIHPDQSENSKTITDKCHEMISAHKGKIHRHEDWGKRQLSYPIRKLHKAHYVLMNIEMPVDALNELKHHLRYNDAILRHLIIREDEAITEPSAMMQSRRKEPLTV